MIWSNIKKLISGVEQSSSTQPVLHKIIQRKESYLKKYNSWVSGMESEYFAKWIHREYQKCEIVLEDQSEFIDFIDLPSVKGFVIHLCKCNGVKKCSPLPFEFATDLQSCTPHFYIDFLKNQVKKLGYRTYCSDMKMYEEKNAVMTKERHYLKPPIKMDQELNNQGYGNITIELLLKNDFPKNIKFSATTYKDHQFEMADSFSELILNMAH